MSRKSRFHDPNTMTRKCETCEHYQFYDGKGFLCEKKYCKHESQYKPIIQKPKKEEDQP